MNRLVAVGLLVHVLHVVEEWLTGFHVLFPRRMDLTPWPTAVFLGFNLAWLITWSACIPALRARCRLALAPLWFLGLGAAINGVAHPALAWLAGGYFPGLISAPLVGVLGVLLLRALATATADLSEPGPLPA
ncbi:MAG: HXXEE domain-containing protein [Acidobacteriota bacterium]